MTTYPNEFADRVIEGVLSLTGPRASLVPLVLDSPHSGEARPEGFAPAVPFSQVLDAADSYVDDLFSAAPDHGAPLLKALFPRAFLDVNRSLQDIDLELVSGDWPHARRDSGVALRGMGLIWRYAWGKEPMYAAPLGVAETEARIARYYQPYHATLAELIGAMFARFRCVYHLDCHSMASQGHGFSSDAPGARRADFVIGDLMGTSAEPEYCAVIAETLRKEGYEVAMNVPFRGAELVEAYAAPAQGRHSVQLEINRRLYMNEQTREKTADYAGTKAALTKLCTALAAYAADRAGVKA